VQTLETLARDHYSRRLKLSERVTTHTLRLWQTVNFNELDASWDGLSPSFNDLVSNGAVASATLAQPFVERAASVQQFAGQSGVTDPLLYGEVAPDGRALRPLLYGAVTTTKTATGAGYSLERAAASGAAFLAAAVKTVIQDMGRQADMVASNARGFKHYTRAISPGACSRCAVLAGIYSSAVAFPRHPNCKCVAVPVPDDPNKRGSVGYESVDDYFDSLSRAEQNRIFTNAGAQAIRDGADPNQVVNARRGAAGIQYGSRDNQPQPPGRRLQRSMIGVRADGTPLMVYTTGEGSTRRSSFRRQEGRLLDESRRTTRYRLMPEQIYVMAGNDPERARELLIRYGYIFQ